MILYCGETLSVLPEGRSFTANTGTKVAVLFKSRSSTANSGTMVAVLLGANRYGSFLLPSAPYNINGNRPINVLYVRPFNLFKRY